MAKIALLLLLQAVTFMWCINACSATIKNEEAFVTFIQNKVIKKFRPWVKYSKGQNFEQFAVMLLMDTDSDWNSFKYLPENPVRKTHDDVQPPERTILSNLRKKQKKKDINYVATVPAEKSVKREYIKEDSLSEDQKKKKMIDVYLHAEQRIFIQYYRAVVKSHPKIPKAIVIYSWIVPCIEQPCSSRCSEGCTDQLINKLRQFVEYTQVIVAYTSQGTNVRSCTCDEEATKRKFAAAGIDYVKVPYNDKVAIIEDLMKMGTMLELLEE